MEYRKKILIVDDEQNFVDIMKLNLENAGFYEVKGLTDATQIISVIRSFKPKVILLDLIMPGIDGFKVCEMLKNDPIGREIPIIILSVLRDDVDKIKAFRLKVADYFVKPTEVSRIIAAIEKAIDFKLIL